jgi:hypothetical protein
MDRQYSRFPGGSVGFGLLVLRLTVATSYVATGVPILVAHSLVFFPALVLTVGALFLTAGVRTSLNAGIGCACSALLLPGSKPDHWFSALLLTCLSLSLALLGPGGYSLEARLSGWRTIDLSPRPHSDGTGN